MVGQGSESRSGFKLSWADEVEREEREEVSQSQSQSQSQSRQKSNPFGSARPREVVLQERGIDWRILDQDQQVKNRYNEKPPVLVSHRNQIPLAFVPPVRYSYISKNAVANWVEKPCTPRKNCFDSEKENVFHKHKKSDPRRDKNPNLCQQKPHIGSKEFENKTRESHKNQRNAGSHRKRTELINRRNSVFSPPVNEEIDRKLHDLKEHGKEVRLVDDTDVKSEKAGQSCTKTKRSRRRKRRRKNTASNKSGTGFQEICNATMPSCVPLVTKMKKTGNINN